MGDTISTIGGYLLQWGETTSILGEYTISTVGGYSVLIREIESAVQVIVLVVFHYSTEYTQVLDGIPLPEHPPIQ